MMHRSHEHSCELLIAAVDAWRAFVPVPGDPELRDHDPDEALQI